MKLPSINKILFLFFLVFYSTVGYYLALDLNIYHNDAIARTALAFFTIFGRDPHLAAIGFVWQPLPSLMQIPLILALRPFGLMMLSGPFITALAGAVSVATVYKIGVILNKNKKKLFPLIIAALFGFNPMIVLYSSLGTSEMIFLVSMLLSSFYFLKWFYFAKQRLIKV